MTLRVCLAGATGWAGSELARAIARAPDLDLVAAVSRTYAGQDLRAALGSDLPPCPVFATAQQALERSCDVFVEYTGVAAAKANVLAALDRGAHVVVGSSGLTDEDYAQIDRIAQAKGLGVLACGNFALTVVLLQKFAELAARYIPQWEIIDYAHDGKRDAPSGTVRELAHRLAAVRTPQPSVPLEQTAGVREARGAMLAGSQVHSIRLPGFVISAEVIFGMPDQKLTLRHDAGDSARPYVDGALLAVRKAPMLVGLHRGLDRVLDL